MEFQKKDGPIIFDDNCRPNKMFKTFPFYMIMIMIVVFVFPVYTPVMLNFTENKMHLAPWPGDTRRRVISAHILLYLLTLWHKMLHITYYGIIKGLYKGDKSM